ncbi:MAG: phosphoadenylyl-sulfate reductase [Zetaproteobacteria bacterium CG_4_9_14_3_um_filter_49_83]|nr:MAG: phosphoadenylyl-sulfate reductase [Zetaproteobacteria bacterium CG17_big_fil_post_rev_8_21_14_2_50_50_13]PIV30602.1 MAG: phosphoadenylyl-sulfate reductase [Zetaproteobacteria bacterium CG02_land_8_20_14_3_00_50_9]PIY54682.1 MAG: phosphoadenylyl-sulfate reductase [Zetaproteobacteria bacterium CG_4_10_14_0_8_um_filter_49_80]PJA35712.1 MAG: phosphoadenylyl-sulfate reductase [Zetaproteobacteria bacterium CG_4_9_14_3_um_filter_49_83]
MKPLVESALAMLRQAKQKHGDKIVYACSMGLQGMVLIDLIAKHELGIRVVTLDTGRLPQQTYDLIDVIRKRYHIELDVRFPDAEEVQDMVRERGVNLFLESVENRKLCCAIRKIHPLDKALDGMEAWITGRRRDESVNRESMQAIEVDPVYGRIKYNPMANWSAHDVWKYIREHDLPYNSLYNAHYASIGCACCTRAITVGEDPRAGRWWWENEETLAECGLHVSSIIRSQVEGELGEGI